MQNIKISKGKNKFTFEEDQIIRWFVEMYGRDFTNIQIYLPNRTARQCRERWKNYLDPSIKQERFSSEENLLLVEKYFEKKRKWSEIAKYFNGRTDVKLKNQFDYIKRNQLFGLNFAGLFEPKANDSNYKQQDQEIEDRPSPKEDLNLFDWNDSLFFSSEEFFNSGKEFFQEFL
jgi:hypothetical protein